MRVKSLFQLAYSIGLLGLCWSFAACGEDKAPQKNQVAAPVSTPSSSTAATAPESSSSTPQPSNTFKPRLDTASSARRIDQSAASANVPKTVKTEPVQSPSKVPGSVAYVTRATAVLYKEPNEKSKTISGTFKVSETIYLLETKMTDETGKAFDIPQWYKIQRQDGRQGWLKARFVGLPI